jgi:hypothetical protein
VIGVLRAVHVEGKLSGKDKKRLKEDSAAALAEVLYCYPTHSPFSSAVFVQ